MRVLVVEDAVEYREFISQTLERAGFEVDTASDGCEAMDCIERCLPDAVICDVVMPRKSGFGVLEELRRGNRRIPVILTSTFHQDWALEQARELGAAAYLDKDVDASELLRALRTCLPQASLWSVPAPPSAVPKVVYQDMIRLGNDPTQTVAEYSSLAAVSLAALSASERFRMAQGVSRAARVVIACGNLELPPDLLYEPDIDIIMAFRAMQPRFEERLVSVLTTLERDRLRVQMTGQGRDFDYRTLADKHLAIAEKCAGCIRFPDDGRKIELIHRLDRPLTEDDITRYKRGLGG
jgi:DNA-binding response OmpR family regulator